MEIGNAIKENSAKKYGTPPCGRAELSSLDEFARKERLDTQKSIELLRAAGVQVKSADQILKTIAAGNKLSPQQVYGIIKPAKTLQAGVTGAETTAHGNRARLPEDPLLGFGRKTLAEACTELGLEPEAIATSLKALGIAAEPGMTMNEIAEDCGTAPREVYEIIRTIAEQE